MFKTAGTSNFMLLCVSICSMQNNYLRIVFIYMLLNVFNVYLFCIISCFMGIRVNLTIL